MGGRPSLRSRCYGHVLRRGVSGVSGGRLQVLPTCKRPPTWRLIVRVGHRLAVCPVVVCARPPCRFRSHGHGGSAHPPPTSRGVPRNRGAPRAHGLSSSLGRPASCACSRRGIAASCRASLERPWRARSLDHSLTPPLPCEQRGLTPPPSPYCGGGVGLCPLCHCGPATPPFGPCRTPAGTHDAHTFLCVNPARDRRDRPGLEGGMLPSRRPTVRPATHGRSAR